jgi:hypothetical protein
MIQGLSISIASCLTLALTIVPTVAVAEEPLWRLIKGDFGEFRIMADPSVVRDPRMAFILENRHRYADNEIREWDEFAHEEKKKADGISNPQEDIELSLTQLGASGRYAALLSREAMCAGSCASAEWVALYQLPEQREFKKGDALDLDNQDQLLRRLIDRDRQRIIGPVGEDCGKSTPDSDGPENVACLSLSELLGINGEIDDKPVKAAEGVVALKREIAGVGFTTDSAGVVATLDIFISSAHQFSSHYRALKWPIEASLGSALLKPAFHDLMADKADAAPK